MTLRIVPGLLAVLLLAGCGGSSKPEASTTPTTTDANGCIPASPPKAKPRTAQKPTKHLPARKTYEVVIRTNCGSFTIRLDPKTSPNTAASFASLARKGFFNGTVFHRIVPGFVIQGGDPTGTGQGGPGYTTVDKPPANTLYTHGLVAMAKAATDPPGTSGSQFFVVTTEDAQLPPDYAVLGTIVEGIDTIDKVGELGDPATGGEGTPTETVEIEKATLRVR